MAMPGNGLGSQVKKMDDRLGGKLDLANGLAAAKPWFRKRMPDASLCIGTN